MNLEKRMNSILQNEKRRAWQISESCSRRIGLAEIGTVCRKDKEALMQTEKNELKKKTIKTLKGKEAFRKDMACFKGMFQIVTPLSAESYCLCRSTGLL